MGIAQFLSGRHESAETPLQTRVFTAAFPESAAILCASRAVFAVSVARDFPAASRRAIEEEQ